MTTPGVSAPSAASDAEPRELQTTACPVCGSSAVVSVKTRMYDDRYAYPGAFRLLKCTRCRHLFLDATFSPDQIRSLYSDYYPRSNFKLEDHRPHRERTGFAAWLDGARSKAYCWVPRNVRVLDIGCGFGETLGYHRSRGCEVYGVEADENILRVAKKFGYDVKVGLFDPAEWQNDFFDYVTMDQVIEHVQDPVKTLQGIAQVLKPGGTAILGTPNPQGWGAKIFGRRWINWHTPYHLQFFSLGSMRAASERAGLELVRTVTVTPSAWLHFQWIHLLNFPARGERSPFWAATSGVRYGRWRGRFLRVLMKLDALKVNHLVTRVFDALGVGDSRLFILRKPLQG